LVYHKHISTARRLDVKAVRCETVAKLYLRGDSHKSIADRLGVSLNTIKKDIEYCREIWRSNCLRTMEQHLAENLAKIDEAEAAAWSGWEKSQKDEMVNVTEEKDTPDGTITTSRTVRRGQSGQAAFVATITKLIELRCKLLGLLGKDVADKSINTANFNVVSIVVDNREEAERMRTLTVDQFAKKVEESEGQP